MSLIQCRLKTRYSLDILTVMKCFVLFFKLRVMAQGCELLTKSRRHLPALEERPAERCVKKVPPGDPEGRWNRRRRGLVARSLAVGIRASAGDVHAECERFRGSVRTRSVRESVTSPGEQRRTAGRTRGEDGGGGGGAGGTG